MYVYVYIHTYTYIHIYTYRHHTYIQPTSVKFVVQREASALYMYAIYTCMYCIHVQRRGKSLFV